MKAKQERFPIPAWAQLPSMEVLERLSLPDGGPMVQGELFPPEPTPNTREARMTRLLLDGGDGARPLDTGWERPASWELPGGGCTSDSLSAVEALIPREKRHVSAGCYQDCYKKPDITPSVEGACENMAGRVPSAILAGCPATDYGNHAHTQTPF